MSKTWYFSLQFLIWMLLVHHQRLIPQIKLSSLFQISMYYLGRNRILSTQHSWGKMFDQKSEINDFSGGPVVNTPSFQRRGQRFNPWSGNQNLMCHMAWTKNKNYNIKIVFKKYQKKKKRNEISKAPENLALHREPSPWDLSSTRWTHPNDKGVGEMIRFDVWQN